MGNLAKINSELILINQALGTTLRDFRKKKNLRQRDIGVALGITAQQINKYENGVNRIQTNALLMLLPVFDVSISEFFAKYEKNRREIDVDNGVKIDEDLDAMFD